MVDLQTAIEELNTGRIEFNYNEDCCTTPGEVVILLERLADLESKKDGNWEDVQEEELYCPDIKTTITRTTQTCSCCKTRIGFIGPKRYLADAHCPSCGGKMGNSF